jgi:hypothetical protein
MIIHPLLVLMGSMPLPNNIGLQVGIPAIMFLNGEKAENTDTPHLLTGVLFS